MNKKMNTPNFGLKSKSKLRLNKQEKSEYKFAPILS